MLWRNPGVVGAMLVLLGVGLASHAMAGGAASGTAGPSGCVSWSAQARPAGFAFDHTIDLESRCQAVVTCDIRSSTNPQSMTATLQPSDKKTLLIWRGSPAREVTAEVTCRVGN